jgi:hypothetical protein
VELGGGLVNARQPCTRRRNFLMTFLL